MRAGDVLARKYEIVELAATGGMSTVYRARSVDDGATYAVKVVIPGDAAGLRRFEREIALLRSLSAPGIVSYIEHGTTDDGRLYLVQEWVGTATLGRHLRDVGLTCAEAVAVALRICDALGPAHAAGIVHRDLKPDNIALVDGALHRVKLLDFGIALGADQSRLTQTGVVVGTPGYMGPEQISGRRDIDPRADVFGLGCILYECLSGRFAFAGSTLTAVRMKVVLGDPPPLHPSCPEAPRPLIALVESMLAKQPAARPTDAAAIAAQLRALPDLNGLEAVRRPVGRSEAETAIAPLRAAADPVYASVAVGIVVCATNPDAPSHDAAAVERAVDAAVAPHASVRVFPDGTLVLLVPADTPRLAAVRGVRAAVAAHRVLDGWSIAVTCIHDGRNLSDAIDWVAECARLAAARQALHGEVARIWIDDDVVPFVDGEFPVRGGRHGFAVIG